MVQYQEVGELSLTRPPLERPCVRRTALHRPTPAPASRPSARSPPPPQSPHREPRARRNIPARRARGVWLIAQQIGSGSSHGAKRTTIRSTSLRRCSLRSSTSRSLRIVHATAAVRQLERLLDDHHVAVAQHYQSSGAPPGRRNGARRPPSRVCAARRRPPRRCRPVPRRELPVSASPLLVENAFQ